MNLKEAKTLWETSHPDIKVTYQTIINWVRKFQLGKKKNFLPRSEWEIDDKKFEEFVNNPESFLRRKPNENN